MLCAKGLSVRFTNAGFPHGAPLKLSATEIESVVFIFNEDLCEGIICKNEAFLHKTARFVRILAQRKGKLTEIQIRY